MIPFIKALDMRIIENLSLHRDLMTTYGFIAVTELGSAVVIGGLGVVLALVLLLRRRFAEAQGIVVAIVTSAAATVLIKTLVARARPAELFWAYQETGFSFPSAHASMSLAFWGFLAYMLWQSNVPRAWRIAGVAVLSILVLVIGFSRLYLGVHYFSDVVGGYVLGALCLWLAITLTRILERPRK